MANIYEKMQKVRVELQKMNLKKTGKNQTFKYYELADFLPHAMELFEANKLFSNVSFGSDLATLVIVNTEKPDEKEVWTSTIAGASERLGAPIQQLGAMQTYLRRYLYINALEIVESDALDATADTKEESKKETAEKKDIKTELRKMINDLAEGSIPKAKELFKAYTSFKGKDGNMVEGKDKMDGMSDKAIQATYGKVKIDWLKLNK